MIIEASKTESAPSQDELLISYNAIFKNNYSYVFRYVVWRGFDTALADDIVQEVFLRLWKSIEKTYNHPEIRRWLFRAARFVMHDEYIKQKSAGEITNIDIDTVPTSSVALSSDIIDFLDDTLHALSNKHEEIIRLIFYEDLSLAQCAERLGISLSAAKKRSSRAQKELLKIVEKEGKIKNYLLLCHFLPII